jgi:hypothetical protein
VRISSTSPTSWGAARLAGALRAVPSTENCEP